MIDMTQSKWIQAVFTLVINLGTSYVVSDVQSILQGIFEYKFMKWLVVFAICFASTKDVYVSICISFLFAFTMWFLLDETCEVKIPSLKKKLQKMLIIKTDDDTLN